MSALGRWIPQGWHQRWMDLSGRERLGLGLALGVLALALLWSLGVAPAWRQWQPVERLGPMGADRRCPRQRCPSPARRSALASAPTMGRPRPKTCAAS